MKPHLARFKDGNEIRKLVVQVVSRVETIKKNHQQSGHHSSGDERLQEIRSSFLSPKGKNVDIPFFYAFLMLDNVDLTLATDPYKHCVIYKLHEILLEPSPKKIP
jgi:hypothetical protein